MAKEAKNTSPNEGEKKGRPTPKRKVAESKNIVNSLAPATTKEARANQRINAKQKRLEARAAYMRGDENALPARDRGPVKRFVRDFIDARRSPGEYIFYMLFVLIFTTLAIKTPAVQAIVLLIMYVLMFYIAIYGFLLRRKVIAAVKVKFPNESTKGIGMYAFMRSTQVRKLRAPSPRVKPGDKVE
jgi:uncharacterized membrane protein